MYVAKRQSAHVVASSAKGSSDSNFKHSMLYICTHTVYRETKKGKLCVSFREKKKKITRPFRRLTRGGGALAEAKDNIWGDNTTSAGREISGGLREEYAL